MHFKMLFDKNMVNTTAVSIYIDSQVEEEATAILAEIGLTPSDDFRLLMTRVAKDQSFPPELFVPNAETISALEDVESGRVTSFGNLQEFMDDLYADDFDFIKFRFDNVLF